MVWWDMVNFMLSCYHLVLEHKGHVGKSHVSKKKEREKIGDFYPFTYLRTKMQLN